MNEKFEFTGPTRERLREQLRQAFHNAIVKMGMERFRETSFFGSNETKGKDNANHTS